MMDIASFATKGYLSVDLSVSSRGTRVVCGRRGGKGGRRGKFDGEHDMNNGEQEIEEMERSVGNSACDGQMSLDLLRSQNVLLISGIVNSICCRFDISLILMQF